MTTSRLLPSLLSAACAWACDEAPAPAADAPRVTTQRADVTFPAAPALLRYQAGGAIVALADDDGVPLAATADGLVALAGNALAPLSVVAAADEPLATGAVHAFARRASGLLVSAEAGLFHTFEGALVLSPASAALSGASALSLARDGDLEVVWAALPDGLHRLDAQGHQRIVLPDEAGAPTAIAALPDAVLLAYADRLYELDPADLAYRRVPLALGAISQALAAGERLFAAGSDGLVERQADGSYRAYDGLGPVMALAGDAHGIAYARTAAGVLRLDPSGPVGFAPLPDAGASYVGLALDGDGHVWLGEGAELVRLATGKVVSFAADVAPILEARCAGCHADGERAPRRDFTDYDIVLALSEAIFARVSTGLMPPPPSPGLDAAEYDLLVRWYAGERAP